MKKSVNNNCDFYEDLDTNFNLACSLCERKFSKDELINMLEYGNIPEKQIAALVFDNLNNEHDASVLISNLTGCDGKIREAVALKINTLLDKNENNKKIFAGICAEQFADATVDINANICRLVIDSAVILKNYDTFSKKYTDIIIKKTKDALHELDKFIFRDKKYTINKQLFKLYWCLEALSDFYPFTDEKTLSDILEKCSSQQEYTIREKTAKIVAKSNKFDKLRKKLINDDNYYVREIFLHHPSLL